METQQGKTDLSLRPCGFDENTGFLWGKDFGTVCSFCAFPMFHSEQLFLDSPAVWYHYSSALYCEDTAT